MKKYKDAFSNITVPEDMASRIFKSAEAPERNKAREIFSHPKSRRTAVYRIMATAACLTLVVTAGLHIALTRDSITPDDTIPKDGLTSNSGVTLGNPFVTLSSPDEFPQYLTFSPSLPETMPDDWEPTGYTVIDGILAQVRYTNASSGGSITYRTGEGSNDVSGNYTSYEQIEQTGGFTLKGAEGMVSLITWNSDGCSHSLSFSPALPSDSALAVAQIFHPGK